MEAAAGLGAASAGMANAMVMTPAMSNAYNFFIGHYPPLIFVELVSIY